jgi:hypothetical protein
MTGGLRVRGKAAVQLQADRGSDTAVQLEGKEADVARWVHGIQETCWLADGRRVEWTIGMRVRSCLSYSCSSSPSKGQRLGHHHAKSVRPVGTTEHRRITGVMLLFFPFILFIPLYTRLNTLGYHLRDTATMRSHLDPSELGTKQ